MITLTMISIKSKCCGHWSIHSLLDNTAVV